MHCYHTMYITIQPKDSSSWLYTHTPMQLNSKLCCKSSLSVVDNLLLYMHPNCIIVPHSVSDKIPNQAHTCMHTTML